MFFTVQSLVPCWGTINIQGDLTNQKTMTMKNTMKRLLTNGPWQIRTVETRKKPTTKNNWGQWSEFIKTSIGDCVFKNHWNFQCSLPNMKSYFLCGIAFWSSIISFVACSHFVSSFLYYQAKDPFCILHNTSSTTSTFCSCAIFIEFEKFC